MQVQSDNSSEESLSKYKKSGYEYVEEEEVVLDALVALYRKRLEIMQNHLKAMEELHSMARTSFDPASTLYGQLVLPVLDCIQRDIEGYQRYAWSTEIDLASITFSAGPRPVVQDIKQDTETAQLLFSEYEKSCVAVSKSAPRTPSTKNGWKIRDEDIIHREITARLHPKQEIVRTQFESTYLDLLDDHMEYMEQVKKLVETHPNRRSELSTAIACNAGLEKESLDKFLTADAIAVPYLKLDLGRDRREYRHAPKKLEERRTVILGRYLEPSEDDPAQEVLIACLERLPKVDWRDGYKTDWEWYWDIIHAIEMNSSEPNIYKPIFGLRNGYQVESLIYMIMSNTRMPLPLLNADVGSFAKLRYNIWDKSALMKVMKDVDPRIKRIMKGCAIAEITSPMRSFDRIVDSISWTRNGRPAVDSADAIVCNILVMWDYDNWRPLPEYVQWSGERGTGGFISRVCRMKRYRAKPGYEEDRWISEWLWLEVDENGSIVETETNQRRKTGIQEEPKSRIAKFLRKLDG